MYKPNDVVVSINPPLSHKSEYTSTLMHCTMHEIRVVAWCWRLKMASKPKKYPRKSRTTGRGNEMMASVGGVRRADQSLANYRRTRTDGYTRSIFSNRKIFWSGWFLACDRRVLSVVVKNFATLIKKNFGIFFNSDSKARICDRKIDFKVSKKKFSKRVNFKSSK